MKKKTKKTIKKTAKRKVKKSVLRKKKISKSSVNKMIADFIKRIEAI